MKNNKKILSLTALTLMLAAGANTAFAYQGDYSQEGPNCTSERHEAIEAAFDNNDYNAWSEQMTSAGRVRQVINEDNFAQFAEAHRLGQAGDTAVADAIRAELGLRVSNGNRMNAEYRGANGIRDGQGQNKSGHSSNGVGYKNN